MKKKIWIMNHYATNMFDAKGGRHYWFAKNLKMNGYEPTLFCANTYHNSDKTIATKEDMYAENQDEHVKMIYVKTTKYVGNGISRIKNMFFFAKNLFRVTRLYTKKTNETPDIILASSVHPLTCVAGIFIAKRYGVPCIVEIRDLWPESIVAYSEKLTKNNVLIKILYKGEKWIYKKADRIIFTAPGWSEYIKEQGWEKDIDLSKIYHINNGVDLEAFNFNKENYKTEDEDLENGDILKIVYTGTIRKVNDLGILLDVVKKIDNPKVKFLVWGDGDQLEMLKDRVEKEHITNVCFKGSVPKQQVPYILSKADINLMHNKATDILRVGISWNKLFEYYAAKKPIITTLHLPYTSIDEKTGYNVSSQSSAEVAQGIDYVLENFEEIQKNANEIFSEQAEIFDFKNLTQTLINIIENM